MNFILNLFTKNNSDIPKNKNYDIEIIEEDVTKEDECNEKIENVQINESKNESSQVLVTQDVNENKDVGQGTENEQSFDDIKEEEIIEVKENENTNEEENNIEQEIVEINNIKTDNDIEISNSTEMNSTAEMNDTKMNDIDIEFDFMCYGIYDYRNDPKTITIYYLNCVYQEFWITKKVTAFILVNKELDLRNDKESFEEYYKQFTNTCYFNELYYSERCRMEIQFIFYNDINDQSTWIIKDGIQSKGMTIKPRSGMALYAKQNTDSYDYTIQKYVIPQYPGNTNSIESNTWKVCYCTPKRKQDYSVIEYTQLEVQYNMRMCPLCDCTSSDNTIIKYNGENVEIAVGPYSNTLYNNVEKYNDVTVTQSWYDNKKSSNLGVLDIKKNTVIEQIDGPYLIRSLNNTYMTCYESPNKPITIANTKSDSTTIDRPINVTVCSSDSKNGDTQYYAYEVGEDSLEILINAEQDVKYNESDGSVEWYEVILKGFQKVKNENKENEYDYSVYDNLPFNMAWAYWKESVIQIDAYDFIPVFNGITHYDPQIGDYEKSPQFIALDPNANVHYVFNTMIEFCKNTKYNPSIIERDNEGNIIKIGNEESNDIDKDENPREITKYEFKFKVRNYTELKDITPNSQKSWCVFNAGIYIHKGVTFESQIPVYINLQGGPIKVEGTITAPELIINSENEEYTQCEMNKPPDVYW